MVSFLDSILGFGELARQGASSAVEAVNPGTLDGNSTANDLAQSKYNFDYLVFPNDIGMDNMAHYMVININVPTQGFGIGTQVRSAAGQYTNQFEVLTSGNMQSKVDTLRFGGSGGTGVDRAGLEQVPRQTRRIAESIALFMPQGLYFNSQNEYQNISLAATGGRVLSGVAGAFGGADVGAAAGQLLAGGSEALGIMKNPINPAVEVIFNTTNLRTFSFSFNFAPRNEEESINLRSIIKTLRFHAAPEINNSWFGGGIGLTWIPPAEFDITFFHKGRENFALPRINTCVMERIDVDYHPTGKYATFYNGFPVAVRMDLHFREVEIIHKARVIRDF
jgi:hypothetical protein